jgi:glycosyltransferase involved in cell wall biosynthesis
MSLPYAVIIPACNEQECIGPVLDELRASLAPAGFLIAVGVNGSADATAAIARAHGAIVAETALRGYGHGCRAAIEHLAATGCAVAGYIFISADGANAPDEIERLVAAHAAGAQLVLGTRTTKGENIPVMTLRHVVANRFLGIWCGLLTGRCYTDLGPMRLIDREFFEDLSLREWTFGWTIEAQVRAAMLRARIVEVPVRERPRLAGVQKVSGVSWRRSLRIGLAIMAAGLRARQRRVSSPAGQNFALPVRIRRNSL